MISERTSQSKLWLVVAVTSVVIVLLGVSIRALIVPGGKPQPSGAVSPEPAVGESIKISVENQEPGPVHHEHAVGVVAATSPVPAAPVPSVNKSAEFTADYKTLSEREAGRKEMIENLREIAKDNPDSGYARTPEQLRKFEKSGASFQ